MYGGWLGILKWSLAQTDGTRPSEVKAMSDIDKKWLEDAFQSITVDETKRMRELGLLIARPEDSLEDSERIAALEELQDFVESIDNAKNLFAIGAFEAVRDCLYNSRSSAVRRSAASTLSTTVQNNPKAQEWALHGGLHIVLLRTLVEAEECIANALGCDGACLERGVSAGVSSALEWSTNDALRLAATTITALSSLVRHNAVGEAWLSTSGALHALTFPVELAATRGVWGAPPAATSSTSDIRPSAQQQGADDESRELLLRLARKALFFIRSSTGGTRADACKSLLLQQQPPESPAHSPPPFVAALSRLLSALHPPAAAEVAALTTSSYPGGVPSAAAAYAAGSSNGGDDADTLDSRESALHILLALASASPAAAASAVVDDSGDRRKPRSLYGPGDSAAAPASSAGNAYMADNVVSSGSAVSSASEDTVHSSAPVVLTLPQRVDVLRACVLAVQQHPPATPASATGTQRHTGSTLTAVLALHCRWCAAQSVRATAAAAETSATETTSLSVAADALQTLEFSPETYDSEGQLTKDVLTAILQPVPVLAEIDSEVSSASARGVCGIDMAMD